MYRACVRSVLLFGVETWATTKQLEALLIQCNLRMLRYLMGIRWQDEISNEEVVRRSGLEGLEKLLRKARFSVPTVTSDGYVICPVTSE